MDIAESIADSFIEKWPKLEIKVDNVAFSGRSYKAIVLKKKSKEQAIWLNTILFDVDRIILMTRKNPQAKPEELNITIFDIYDPNCLINLERSLVKSNGLIWWDNV